MSGRGYGVALAVALGAAACRGDARHRERHPTSAVRLAGLWTAEFVLDAPPLRIDSLRLRPIRNGAVHATLALVANTWLDAGAAADAAPERPEVRPAAYGAFAADFTPFGFEPRRGGRFPEVVVTADGDSVYLVLGPDGDQTRVNGAGVWRADAVSGVWPLWTVGRSGEAASGRFVLRPATPCSPGRVGYSSCR